MKIISILKYLPKKLLVIPLVVFIAIFWYSSVQKPKQAQIQFTKVKTADIKSQVSASGTLIGKHSARLKFKSSGKLAYINVKQGDRVSAGQPVAGLDTKELSIALRQAQNIYTAKDATAKNIEDQVKNHDSDETFAQKDTRVAAQTARDNAYDNLKAAEQAIQEAQIFSPINGLVTQTDFVPGQIVSQSDIIVDISDDSEIFFDADVDEADISKISQNQNAQITLNAYEDDIFEGTVDEIVPQTKTSSSNATTITVRIKLDNPNIKFIPGLNGQAAITTAAQNHALTIPQDALRDDNTVLIKTPNGFRSTKVVTGVKSDIEVEIKSGLHENEEVVENPSQAKNNFQGSNPFLRIFRGVFNPRRG